MTEKGEHKLQHLLQYVGRIPVLVSMRSLDFERRKEMSRFCIAMLAEMAGLRVPPRRTGTADENERELLKMVAREEARALDTTANLEISTEALKVTLENADGEQTGDANVSTRATHFLHDLACVSFAAGGDGELADFVAYVANDPSSVGRACHVLECPGGLANQIVVTIGQAFDLRYSLTHTNGSQSNNNAPRVAGSPSASADAAQSNSASKAATKCQNPRVPSLRTATPTQMQVASDANCACQRLPPIPQLPPPMDSLQSPLLSSSNSRPQSDNSDVRYENEEAWLAANSGFAVSGPPVVPRTGLKSAGPTETGRDRADPNEPPPVCTWYHGVLSRNEAESLLVMDGDFLVRASATTPGQYILSGVYAGQPKHLLLVDPNGRVRTSDREFESVQTLIEYHMQQHVPIVSHDSRLTLTMAVCRQ